MEFFAVGPSFLTIVQAADGLLHLAASLKASIDKVKENKETHRRLSRNIIKHLKQLKHESQRLQKSQRTSHEHQMALQSLQFDLASALNLCNKTDPTKRCRLMRWFHVGKIEGVLMALDDHIRRSLQLFNTGAIMRVEASLEAIGQAMSDNTFEMKAHLVSVQDDLDHVRRSVDLLLSHHNLDASDTKSLLDSGSPHDTFKSARSRSQKTLEILSLSLAAHSKQTSPNDTITVMDYASSTAASSSPKDAVLEVIDSLRTLRMDGYTPSARELDQLAVALFIIGQVTQAKDVSRQAVAHFSGEDSDECRGRIYLNLSSHLYAAGNAYEEVRVTVETAVRFYRRAKSKDGLSTGLDHQAAILLSHCPSSSEGICSSAESVSLRRALCDRSYSPDATAQYATILCRHALRLCDYSSSHQQQVFAEALRCSTESIALYQELRESVRHREQLRQQHAASLRVHALCLRNCRRLSAAVTTCWDAVDMLRAQPGTTPSSTLVLVAMTFLSFVSSAKDEMLMVDMVTDLRDALGDLKDIPPLEATTLAGAACTSAGKLDLHRYCAGLRSLHELARDIYDQDSFGSEYTAQPSAQANRATALHGLALCSLVEYPDTSAKSALSLAQSAVDILWLLPSDASRDTTLADALLTVARCQKALQDNVACVSASETAISLLEGNASDGQSLIKLASTHYALSLLYDHDKPQALTHSQSAYALYQQLSLQNVACLPDLVNVGCTYSQLLSETGRHSDAFYVAHQVNGLARETCVSKVKRKATQRLRACQEINRRSHYRLSFP